MKILQIRRAFYSFFIFFALIQIAYSLPTKNDFAVNDDLGNNYQGQPSLALESHANFVVCWTDRRNRSNDIYAQLFSSDGTPIGKNIRVNDDQTTANQTLPKVDRDGNGNFVIVWVDKREGKAHIYGQRCAGDGTLLGANFRVDDQLRTEYSRSEPVVAVHKTGSFVIAWCESAAYYYIYARFFNSDGTPKGPGIPVTGISESKKSLSLAIDENQNFYISCLWTDGAQSQIRIRKYNSDGSFIYQLTPGEANRQSGWDCPTLAVNGIGEFFITWQQMSDTRYGSWNIYGQRFNSDGTPVGSAFKISEDAAPGQINPKASLDLNGKVIVAWEDARNSNSDIFAQHINANNSFHGINYRVNSDAGVATQSTCDVKIQSGEIFFIWTDKRDVNRSSDIFCKTESWSSRDKISLLYPNGGEVWQIGRSYPILWESVGVAASVKIQFSPTGNLPFTTLIAGTENDGRWEWIPNTSQISNNCTIRIMSLENVSVTDVNDAAFSIVKHRPYAMYYATGIPPTMSLPLLDGRLTEPVWAYAAEESLLFGVNWDTPWKNFTDNLVTWRALWSEVANRIYVAVKVQDDVRSIFDNNDPATIPYQPWCDDSIEFFSDGNNNGGNYEARYDLTQQWRVSGENKRNLMNFPTADNQQIYAGDDFLTAVRTEPDNGNWTCEAAISVYNNYPDDPKILKSGDAVGWEVRYTDSDNKKLTGTYYDYDQFTGWLYSGRAAIDADFLGTMVLQRQVPLVKVTSPNNREALNCIWTITWESVSLTDTVKIEYYCNNFWFSIADKVQNTGSYLWAIPEGLQCQYSKIRISDAADLTVNDESDNFFSIDCSSCNSPGLQIQSFRGLPDDTVFTEIIIEDNPVVIDALGFNLIYNPEILTYTRAEKSGLTNQFTILDAYQLQPGKIKIGGYSTTPIPAHSTGSLIKIYFQILPCERGTESVLLILNLVDDLLGFNRCPGFFTSRENCLLGDVNLDKTLTPGDALCAFQIYLNGGALTEGSCGNECALAAADANCDQDITPGDALKIFKAYLVDEQLPLVCPGNQSGNQPPEGLELTVEQLELPADDEFALVLKTNLPESLRAFGLEFHFPAEDLNFTQMNAGELTQNWYCFEGREKGAGVIKIGGFTQNGGANQAVTIATLHFTKKSPDASQPKEFYFSNLTDDVAKAQTNLHLLAVDDRREKDPAGLLPEKFELRQNFPNPFNSNTTIEYAVPQTAKVCLEILDLHGKHIRTLVAATQTAQNYRVVWNGLTEDKQQVSSGIYFIRLQAGNFTSIRRAVLIR